MEDKYVVVDTISTFRIRYVVPMSKLQQENTDKPVDPLWALDAVTCDEVKEFSQKHLGYQIIDHDVVTESEILKTFDKDNGYLSSWTEDKKLEWIHDCWDSFTGSEKQERYHDYIARKLREER